MAETPYIIGEKELMHYLRIKDVRTLKRWYTDRPDGNNLKPARWFAGKPEYLPQDVEDYKTRNSEQVQNVRKDI